MKTINVLCTSCNESFEFRHPSVNSPADLMKVTIDCPECEIELHAPDDALLMIPMTEYLRKVYERSGLTVAPHEMMVMDLGTGEVAPMKEPKK